MVEDSSPKHSFDDLLALRETDSLSDEALAQYGALRIRMSGTQIVRLVRRADFERNSGAATLILDEYKDFLFSDHRQRLLAMVNKEDFVSSGELAKIRARISVLVANQIPPLWRPELESASPRMARREGEVVEIPGQFPGVDFIVQFGAGSYFERRKVRGILRGKGIHEGIGPATVTDIKRFRGRAMHDGKIDPVLIHDIYYWIHTQFNVTAVDFIDSQTDKTIAHLEKLLEPLRPHDASLESFTGGDIDFINEPTWYLRYSQEDRGKIVRQYKTKACDPSGKYFPENIQPASILDYMCALFPEELASLTEPERWKTIASAIAASGDYSSIMPAQLDDPKHVELKRALFAHIKAAFAEQCGQKPLLAFCSMEKIGRTLGITNSLIGASTVRQFIDSLRVSVLQNIPDDSLRELIDQGKIKLSGLTHGDGAFSRALEERLNKIRK